MLHFDAIVTFHESFIFCLSLDVLEDDHILFVGVALPCLYCVLLNLIVLEYCRLLLVYLDYLENVKKKKRFYCHFELHEDIASSMCGKGTFSLLIDIFSVHMCFWTCLDIFLGFHDLYAPYILELNMFLILSYFYMPSYIYCCRVLFDAYL